MEVVATEVERGPGRAETHLDLRVAAREFAEPRQQPALQELARHAQVEHAAHALAADAVDGPPQLVESTPHPRQQLGAFLGEGHGARVAPEQRDADVGFERFDLRADGRGRDAEFLGSGRETEVSRDGLEDPESVERQTFAGVGHFGYQIKYRLTILLIAASMQAGPRPIYRGNLKKERSSDMLPPCPPERCSRPWCTRLRWPLRASASSTGACSTSASSTARTMRPAVPGPPPATPAGIRPTVP
jgi:hypothetical protein